MCFFVPMSVPWYFWGESLWVAYFVPALLRYTLVLNATWLVNSAAHMWGNRPYDEGINPRENKFVTFSAIGMKRKYIVETGIVRLMTVRKVSPLEKYHSVSQDHFKSYALHLLPTFGCTVGSRVSAMYVK